MIKDRIGICKTSCRNLPPPDHVYGYKAKTDAEGAGALISTWVTANPSEHEGREEIIVYSNVLAIKHGCITARDMRQCTSTPGGVLELVSFFVATPHFFSLQPPCVHRLERPPVHPHEGNLDGSGTDGAV